MSTNITSTSDRVATDSPTSPSSSSSALSSAQEDARKYDGVSGAMAAVPDPAVIARLANDFFAALPGAGMPADSAVRDAPMPFESMPFASTPVEPTPAIDLRAVPGTLPGAVPLTAASDHPREMFSIPALPDARSIPGGPQLPSSPPSGPLNEADFRAIAASLAGALPLAPQVSAAATPSAIPSSPSAGAEKVGPWAAAPQIPPAAEMYSFPGVPAMPTSPQTSPPGGADLAAVPSAPAVAATGNSADGRTDPWAGPVNFPGASEVFSFPRVPGASVPGIPENLASQPSIPASQPALGTIPAAPAAIPVVNAPESAPESTITIPKSASPTTTPEGGADFADAGKSAYPGAATKFPSVSQLFSFPGVPGAQSPPGVPVVPSSVPTKAPAETDLRAWPQAPGFQPTTIPDSSANGWSGNAPGAKRADPQSSSLPPAVESVKFRPDLAPAELGVAKRPLDVRLIRQDFPILQERVNGRPLIWLDNAATTQKPNAVIDRLSYFYQHENSNIHRAAHTLAARATDAYESAREKTRRFLNASSTREIIFVRGTTEGINLIAQAWGRRNVQKDDEVVITWLEHHANIVPWQQLCSEKGARLRVAPVNDRGEIILAEYEKLLSPRTRIVSFSQVSNALGTITPAREMVEMAHRHGACVVVDGAQAVSHMRVDVQALDCDFYVFSGHKIFGPTGIGAVYGKLDVLNAMPPWHGGGNMIVDVTFEKTTYQAAPARFEAGTGNIADAVGLGAALDYVEQIGMESIEAYEHELLTYATAGLLTVPGLRLIGTAREKAGVMSFVLDDVRTEDVGAALSQEGIAVRSGHHCAQPILRRMGVEASVRPSLAFYNTYEEIDMLVAALLRIQAGRSHRG
jgi:cysteine desulfurase/selenocysteine lyase